MLTEPSRLKTEPSRLKTEPSRLIVETEVICYHTASIYITRLYHHASQPETL